MFSDLNPLKMQSLILTFVNGNPPPPQPPNAGLPLGAYVSDALVNFQSLFVASELIWLGDVTKHSDAEHIQVSEQVEELSP